jgi:hypothetical protein
MVTGFLSTLQALVFGSDSPPGSEGNPLQIQAVPGLVTLLDVALYQAVEGELTGTITLGHALLGKYDFMRCDS